MSDFLTHYQSLVKAQDFDLESTPRAKQWLGAFSQITGRIKTSATRMGQNWIQEVFYPNTALNQKKQSAAKSGGASLLNPEQDIKHLMMSAEGLKDIWQFFIKRLNSGTNLDLACFSVLDESGDFVRIKFLYPLKPEMAVTTYEPIISMADTDNHLVAAYQRKDTTFSPNINTLGRELTALIQSQISPLEEDQLPTSAMHIFSVPFIAADKTIAMMTLGFSEMDAFSQAKLSYVYTLRDQVAQLIWNLVLQDRMKSQAQIDNLTGLLSYSYFQQILDKEVAKADQTDSAVTVMILDINNIQEINDQQGHAAGDAAICHLASTVRRLIRGVDTVARYGGDDIVVLLPETDSQTADVIGERFLQGIKDSSSHASHSSISISIGHATYPDDTKKSEYMMKLTEQALHLAKFKGSKTGESTRIAASEMDQLNEKTVLEVFASHVAKKYNNLRVPSIYQDLLAHMEKKPLNATDTVPVETALEVTIEDTAQSITDRLMLETITSLACALDAKDRYTRGHSQAVANYAVALAHALKMTPAQVEEIRLAAFLHDIGKIGIPESILCKQGPLTDKEWDIMKQHPIIGAEQILAPVTSLRPIIPAVLHHHENWDGTGHPHALSGEDIPLGARIVSLVDAFHALTSDRAYRKALPVAEAKQILDAGSGSKWDPNLVEVFFNILNIAVPKSTETTECSAEEAQGPPVSARDTVLNSPLVRAVGSPEEDNMTEIVQLRLVSQS